MQIIYERFINYYNNVSVVRAKILMDSASELPEISDFTGRQLAMGSKAVDLSCGDEYALDSLGNWHKQAVSGLESITEQELINMW